MEYEEITGHIRTYQGHNRAGQIRTFHRIGSYTVTNFKYHTHTHTHTHTPSLHFSKVGSLQGNKLLHHTH